MEVDENRRVLDRGGRSLVREEALTCLFANSVFVHGDHKFTVSTSSSEMPHPHLE